MDDRPKKNDYRNGDNNRNGDWPFALFPIEIGKQLAHDDASREDIAQVGDQLAQSTELLVERGLHPPGHFVALMQAQGKFLFLVQLVDLELLIQVIAHQRLHALAVLGHVACGDDLGIAVPLHDLGAPVDHVAGIGGAMVEVGLYSGLGMHRFARERRLVDMQAHRTEQARIGGNLLPGLEHEDIAHHHIALGHLHHIAVADDGHQLMVVLLVEDGELLLGLQLEVEAQACGQQDGHEDADRLEKHGGAFLQSPVFVARHANGKHANHHEDDDQRVGELLEEEPPQRRFCGRGEHIGAMLLATGDHLCVGKTFISMVFGHEGLVLWVDSAFYGAKLQTFS